MSLACNVFKSHPEHKTHYGPHVVSIHAEHRAVLLAQTDIQGATMYIARYGGNEIAKPCKDCMAYLSEAGIEMVYYTIGAHYGKEYV